MQMIKKRDKLNNSALAQIESGSSSRKFTSQTQQSTNTNSNIPAAVGTSQNGQNKIYNQKLTHDSTHGANETGSSRS